MDVAELERERFPEAARTMADAFVDDPGWKDVGPDDRRRLHAYIRRVCGGVLRVVAWRRGHTWIVVRDGRIAGVLAGLDPGQWPPPQVRAMVLQASGPLLAGPAVLWRSLAADATMHRVHLGGAHAFVWILTVAPAYQRTGVGHALLAKALARADEQGVATYLDTANPANLPYYRSFGFEPVGEARLPRGAPLWSMYRDVR